jgi:hypothetical protein
LVQRKGKKEEEAKQEKWEKIVRKRKGPRDEKSNYEMKTKNKNIKDFKN